MKIYYITVAKLYRFRRMPDFHIFFSSAVKVHTSCIASSHGGLCACSHTAHALSMSWLGFRSRVQAINMAQECDCAIQPTYQRTHLRPCHGVLIYHHKGVKLCNHGRTMWVSAYSYIHKCICDHRHTMHVPPRAIWMPTMSSLHPVKRMVRILPKSIHCPSLPSEL